MSEILTNNKYYKDIADTIRQMKGVATTYKPREMSGALREMYSTEVEGVPPLTFPSNGNNLLNYRIDGANGGVGDRTKNLANSNEMIQGYWAYANGGFVHTNTWICTPKIPCSGNTPYTYQFSNVSRWSGFVFYDENGRYISTSNVQNASSTEYRTYTATSPSNARYLVVNIAGFPQSTDTISVSDLINFQLEEGSTPTDYEPYGYKIPAIISGKNLLKPDGTPTTIRGVSWSYREDGAVVGKRVSSNENISDFTLMASSTFQPGSYIYSCFDSESTPGASKYQSNISINGASYWGTGNYSFVLNEVSTIRVVLRVYPNFTETAIFKPMIRLSSIQESNYEPYIEPTTTNIYLDEPIGANESKELSDTNVNIPTINGTNILSVNTTVQPSKVYVQAPKTNNYNL